MSIKDYWQLPTDDLEGRIYALLKAETAEKGYMTKYDILLALKMQPSPDIDEILFRLLEEDLITERPKGSGDFRVKRDKPRAKPSAFTGIFFCKECRVEVYRHPHIKMRTKKKLQEVKNKSRLALFQHAMRVGHRKAALEEIWVNEHWGDKGFEIPGEVPREPHHLSASQFLGYHRE